MKLNHTKKNIAAYLSELAGMVKTYQREGERIPNDRYVRGMSKDIWLAIKWAEIYGIKADEDAR
jgi:hypothetical protein